MTKLSSAAQAAWDDGTAVTTAGGKVAPNHREGLIIAYERICFQVADPRSTIEDVGVYGELRHALVESMR